VSVGRHPERIGPYVDRLIEVFEASGNYASEEIQAKRKRLILYGVGEPTPEVAAIIADAPGTLEVVWREAPHTCAELRAETERVMERFPQICEGGPQDAGAGLEFSTHDREWVDAEDPQAVLGTRYPVTIEYGQLMAF